MPITNPSKALPPRHPSRTRDLVHHAPDGRRTILTIAFGFHPDDPATPREVAYVHGYRSGADREQELRDLCAILSAALGHGLTAHDMGHPLGDDPGGASRGCSVAALVLAELAGQGAPRAVPADAQAPSQAAAPARL